MLHLELYQIQTKENIIPWSSSQKHEPWSKGCFQSFGRVKFWFNSVPVKSQINEVQFCFVLFLLLYLCPKYLQERKWSLPWPGILYMIKKIRLIFVGRLTPEKVAFHTSSENQMQIDKHYVMFRLNHVFTSFHASLQKRTCPEKHRYLFYWVHFKIWNNSWSQSWQTLSNGYLKVSLRTNVKEKVLCAFLSNAVVFKV